MGMVSAESVAAMCKLIPFGNTHKRRQNNKDSFQDKIGVVDRYETVDK